MAKRKPSFDNYSDDSASSYENSKPSSSTLKPPTKKKSRRAASMRDDDTGSVLLTYPNSHPSSRHAISAPGVRRDALLQWYSGVHESRGMPWRKPYDSSLNTEERAQRAYEVWISEIMLQQTQVATVIPYYNKWLSTFPTINDLAASDIDTVNALWKGLGYYSRAARLLNGARKAVEDLGGRLPDNAKDMESLIPGIGRYTAGAICSIAYNEQVPILDGNVNRLLSRVLALHSNPKSKATLDTLWSGAQAMVTGSSSPGDVNQALIELGSTVCKPRDPACGSCPLKPWCHAHTISQENSAGEPSKDAEVPDIEELCTLCEPIPQVGEVSVPPVTSYPMKVDRKKQREELDIVNVVEWRADGERWFLLIRRPEGGLLAGLHEFPTSPNVSKSISSSGEQEVPFILLSTIFKEPPIDARQSAKARSDAARIQEATASDASPKVVKIQRAGDVVHIFSHIRKTYRVQWVVLEGGRSEVPELVDMPSLPTQKKGKAPTARKVGKGKKARSATADADGTVEGEASGTSDAFVMAMWLRLAEVEHANIGTGVMKVWTLARSLWEADQ